jgi:GT2 family glycosyltransferase
VTPRAAAPRPAPAVLASAIVVNWNGGDQVVECVRSLLEQDEGSLEVLLVDNGSTDRSDLRIEEQFGGEIELIRAGRNLGFGAGNNLGIRASQGRYIVLLNNDAVAAPCFVRELVAAAEESPRIGMVAAKILEYGRRDVIDCVGHLLYPDGLNRGRGRLEVDRGQYEDCRAALFPSGAAALYRRAMLDEIGLFDEDFFLYGDDADLGLRGCVAGWECALAPRAVAYHRYSQSAGAYSSLKAFYVERNRIFVLLKVFPLVLIAASPFFSLARYALQSWGALRGRGAAGRLARDTSKRHLVVVALRAHGSALLGAGRVLRKRWRARRLVRLGAFGFLRMLLRFRLPLTEVALKD